MKKFLELIREKIQLLLKKGAFHIVAGNILTKFVSFFGSILLVRFLSKSELGILSYYENFLGYFTILAGGGMAGGALRFLVLADGMDEKSSCYRFALRRGTVWNVVLALCGAGFFLFYPHPAAFLPYRFLALLFIFCIPVAFLTDLCLSSLRALFNYKLYAILAFSAAATQILSRVFGALTNGLTGTLCGRFLAEASCGVLSVVLMVKYVFRGRKTPPLSKQFLQSYKSYSFQIMLTDGLWAIFMLNDLFLLGQLCGSDTLLADYKVACVIPANLSILVSAVGTFVAPYFTRHGQEGEGNWVQANLLKVVGITGGIMAAATLLCAVLARPIILLLYGEKYLNIVPVMRILLVASFFNNGIRASIANIFSAMGEQKINLMVAGVGIVLQIVLDLLLIPKAGIFGAAIASSIIYFIMGCSMAAVTYKRFFAGSKGEL